jgi:hypothetical protein
LGQFRGNLPDAFIGAFDSRAVSEDDDGGGHGCGTNPIWGKHLRP